MIEVTQEQISPKVKNLFNKGFGALERGTLDFAVDLLSQCVESEPAFLVGRKFLRAAEIRLFKQKKLNMFTHQVIFLQNMPLYIKGKTLLKQKKAAEAVLVGEQLLRKDPMNHEFIKIFSEAAEAGEMPEVAIQTLEMVREQSPEDVVILRLLGDAYHSAGNGKLAREVFEKLDEVRPNDPATIKSLKDAMAMDSMRRDGWQETQEAGGNYRELIKDTKEAVVLEQQAKSVKSEKDVEDLIVEAQSKIAADPRNVNYYRSLARLYVQGKRFDDAIAILTKALEMVAGDPEVDGMLSTTRGQKFEYEIAQMKDAGDNEGAEAKKFEKLQFEFDDLQARVSRYPHDPKLRYEWGVMLFENEYVNEAIQQFQIAQKNPKYRLGSLYHLGLCFKQKGQHDLAKEQFERLLADLPAMDDMKKAVCYELAEVLATLGDSAKAMEMYKQVYQADINYRDVAQKVEHAYSK